MNTPWTRAICTAAVLAILGRVGVTPLAQGSREWLTGEWTLVPASSDIREAMPGQGERGLGRGGRGGSGGISGRGPGGERRGGNPDGMARRRDAMQDILRAPDRMTINQTDDMVIITTGDGRTTRLATGDRDLRNWAREGD